MGFHNHDDAFCNAVVIRFKINYGITNLNQNHLNICG